MANLNFKWGLHGSLPASVAEGDVGALFFTKDEGSLYLGVEAGKAPKRIQGVVQHYDSTTDFANAVKPPYSSDVIYYIADEGALIRWDAAANNNKGKFVIINVTAAEFAEAKSELAQGILDNANDITALEAAVEALEALTGSSADGTSLADRIASLEGRMTTAEGDIDKLEGEVAGLKGRMTTAEGDIDNLQADVLSHGNKISALETWKTNTVTPTLSDHGTRLTNAEGRLDAIDGTNGALASIRGDVSGLGTRMNAVEDLADQNKEDIAAMKLVDAATNSAVTALQNGLTESNGRISTLEGTSAQHTKDIQSLVNADSGLDNRIKAIEGEVPTIKSDIADLKVATNKANAAIGDSNSGILKDIIDLKAKDTSIDSAIDGVKDRVKDVEDAIGTETTDGTILKRLKTVEGTASNNATSIAGINNTLSTKASQSDLNAAKDRITALETADGQQDTKIKANEDAIADIKNNIIGSDDSKGLKKEIKELKAKDLSQDNVISGVKSTAEAADTLSKANKDRLDGHDTAIENLGKADTALDGKITALTTRVSTAEGTITTHGTDITALKGTVATLATKEALNKEIQDRKDADDAVKSELLAKIATEINAANALTYKGGITTATAWDAVKVKDAKIGDTYVVADSNLALNLDLDNNSSTATVKCYAGDLLIATAKSGKSETNGVLAAADIEWVHVQSGYKQELQGKLSAVDVTGSASAKINLTSLNGNGTAGDLGSVTITSSAPNLEVNASSNTITLNMVWGTF